MSRMIRHCNGLKWETKEGDIVYNCSSVLFGNKLFLKRVGDKFKMCTELGEIINLPEFPDGFDAEMVFLPVFTKEN